MSSAAQVALAYVINSGAYGTLPTTPQLINVRMTSETFGPANTYAQSQEITGDGNIADQTLVDIMAQGGFAAEMSYGAHDDMDLAGLRASAWGSPVTVTGTVHSMAAADNSINRSSGSYISDGFLAGRYIRVSGFALATSNHIFKIVSVAATKMVLLAYTVVNDAAGPSVTITMGGSIDNGVTLKELIFEKTFKDLTNIRDVISGQLCTGNGLSISAKRVITRSFSFKGKQSVSGTTTFGNGSNTPVGTNPVMNATTSVKKLLIGGVVTAFTELNINPANNVTFSDNCGVSGPDDASLDDFVATGTVRIYHKDSTLVDVHGNDTATSFAVILQDANGKGYVFELLAAKLSSAKRQASGKTGAVIADYSIVTYKDATTGATMRITRFA